jgi:hypothetical protein
LFSVTLLHPNDHNRNVFVSEEDPFCVTAIIDCQSTSIEPAFVYENDTPDLVEYHTADIPILKTLMSLEGEASGVGLSEDISVEDPEEEAARNRHEKDVLTCRQTFEVVLRGYVRKFYDAMVMDQTLIRPFRYCDASW